MAPTTISLEVTNDHSVPVEPSLGGSVTVLNVSGGTLYYADNSQVSAVNNQGSLTAGQSQTFSPPQWLRSASLSTVTVTVNDPVVSSGSGGFGGSPTAQQSGTASVSAGQYVPFDLSSVNGTLPLPNAPVDKSVVGYKVEAYATGKTLTVTTVGTDTFDTGATSATPTVVLGSAKFYQYNAVAKTWTPLIGDTPISQLDTRYLPGEQGAAATDVGAAQTIDFLNRPGRIDLVGKISQALTVTLNNRVAESEAVVRVALASTGSYNITVTDGVGNNATVTVAGAANTVFVVRAWCPDATNMQVTGGVVTAINGVAVSGTPSAGQVLIATSGTAAAWANQNVGGLFGDGSDGALVFDGTSTVAGLVPVANVYTLTRDLYATTLSISLGATINTAGFRIFCTQSFALSGTLGQVAAAGTAAGAGGVTAANSSGAFGGTTGGAGNTGAGSQGTGTASTNALTSGTTHGGAGGAGGLGSGGAGGAAGGTLNTDAKQLKNPASIMSGVCPSTAGARIAAAAAGGGGGGDATNKGGGGGAGGPLIAIFAPVMTINASGVVQMTGGAGGTPTTGNCGGGGGGGGGLALFFTGPGGFTNAGTITVAGGTHGNGVGTGANGSDGGAGGFFSIALPV